MNTISEEYREIQRELHLNPNYGSTSRLYAGLIAQIIHEIGCQTLCDYGAGKGRLQGELAGLGVSGVDYRPFDPAFPEYGPPRPGQLSVCIDVLEHAEPEYLDQILADLDRVTERLGFFTIHTGPARKQLPDGRNAHLIQKPPSWWLSKLCACFEIVQLQRTQDLKGFWVIVERRASI